MNRLERHVQRQVKQARIDKLLGIACAICAVAWCLTIIYFGGQIIRAIYNL